MRIVLNLVVAGVMVGTLYGLLGFTLTLMFRSTGVLSFAHAGFALVASYMYSGFSCRRGSGGAQCTPDPILPPWQAALVSIATAVVAALVVERFVIRPLQDATSTVKSIATAAVLGLSSGLMLQIYGSTPRAVPDKQQLVPRGGFTVLDVVINWQRFLVFAVSVALVAGLVLVLRGTWFGLGVRAAGQAPDVARLMGVSPTAVSRFNWALGGALSGLAGVLIAPITVVNIGTFSFLLVKGVGAALIGGLVSLPITFAGGIALGIVEAVLPHFWGRIGSAEVGIAALVVGGLYFNRHRLALYANLNAGTGSVTRPVGRGSLFVARWLTAFHGVAGRLPRPIWYLAGLAIISVPLRSEYFAAIGVNVEFYTLMALSLVLITGVCGQPSLMQMGFAGIGAYAVGTGLHHGLPFVTAAAIGLVLCFVLGWICGQVALRFRGVEFAVISLALAAVFSEFVLADPRLKSTISAPELMGVDLLKSRNVFIVVGIATALAFLAVRNLRRSYWGRSLASLREGGRILGHFGVNPTRAEVSAFAASAVIAGLGGAVFALMVNLFGPFQFIPLYSIVILLAAFVGGLRSLWGPVIAGLIFGYGPTLVQNLSTNSANAYPQIISSLLALVLVVKVPDGLSSLFTWARETAEAAPEVAVRFRGGIEAARAAAPAPWTPLTRPTLGAVRIPRSGVRLSRPGNGTRARARELWVHTGDPARGGLATDPAVATIQRGSKGE